jgi:GDP-L-fucose synthase
MSFFQDKNILVTGGTGLIGFELVSLLIKKEPKKIRVVSLDKNIFQNDKIEFIGSDLRYLNNCEKCCEDIDVVFNLMGVTGSPAMTSEKPASFMVPNLLVSINMLEAARRMNVKRYLYTSTYGVYGKVDVMKEDEMWSKYPSDADKYAGWAKRMGELQVEAYVKEFGWKEIAIVRPANVYGPRANFDPKNSMVVASLIKRAIDGQNPLTVWGDGSAIRDFIHCRDVAEGMLEAIEKEVYEPINLGSGTGTSIKELVNIIIDNLKNKPEVIFDTSKPSGDKLRILDTTKAKSFSILPKISLEKGVIETINWYEQNKDVTKEQRTYNAFKEND